MKKNLLRQSCAALAALMLPVLTQAAPNFPEQEAVCSYNAGREVQRGASALSFPTPVATSMLVNGVLVWSTASTTVPTVKPGDTITLRGSGFGAGPDIDFSKIMIGNSRILETDLKMYNQMLDIIAQVNYETMVTHSSWNKDVVSWTDTQVQFKVPLHASKGPIRLQVQKRTGYLNSLLRPGQPHNVIDAQTKRIANDLGLFKHKCDVVSTLSAETKAIAPINVTVSKKQ